MNFMRHHLLQHRAHQFRELPRIVQNKYPASQTPEQFMSFHLQRSRLPSRCFYFHECHIIHWQYHQTVRHSRQTGASELDRQPPAFFTAWTSFCSITFSRIGSSSLCRSLCPKVLNSIRAYTCITCLPALSFLYNPHIHSRSKGTMGTGTATVLEK